MDNQPKPIPKKLEVCKTNFLFIWRWIFSLNPIEKQISDPVKKLLNSIRVTATCRFGASVRLNRISVYSFFTTTILSLGLIFIPLVQNSDVPLHFLPKVLNMMQIFLAVAVLVYSVVNATARYDIRAEALTECGDKLKDLIRSLREDEHKTIKDGQSVDLTDYRQKYRDHLSESENHSGLDFLLCKLEMQGDYQITGIQRLSYILRGLMTYSIPFVIPTLMMVTESIFILDMLGITSLMTSYFGGDPLLPTITK